MSLLSPELAARLRQCAVFDLDGTIVDTAPTLGWAINESLRDVGLAQLTAAAVRRCIGLGLERFVDLAMLELEARPVGDVVVPVDVDRVRTLFAERVLRQPCRGAALTSGAGALLAELHGAGTPVGVCTNKPSVPADAVLAGLGLRPFVDVLVGGDALPKRKPDAMPLLHCLDQLGVAASSALLVGDSAVDLATGRAAGCAVVLVRGGYESSPLDELGADAVIDRLDDLLSDGPAGDR